MTVNSKNKLKTSAFIGGTAGLLLAVSAPSVLAQEVKAANAGSANTDSPQIEEIEVTAVRSALESALDAKRNASTIVDGIDASDIGSLPALDLGEALQAIPGIQVNRDSERRSSEINLRGLDGGFVKTTANGQSFATPSRSSGVVGGSNPFGSFEASVFDGVTVYKTPTAAHQEGGIAGVVDKKLQKALARPDGRYVVNVGTRYEDLNDSFDNEMSLSLSKHLIADELAVAFKLAGSEQNFRRDSVLFNRYQNLTSSGSPGFDAWKAEHGLPDDAIVRAPVDVRQLSETSSGDRVSFTGNIEWQATENLKLSADVLYTERNLDDNNFEQLQTVGRIDGNWVGTTVTPVSDPFVMGKGDEGETIYGVSAVEIENASYLPGNRIFNFYEQAQGVFLNAEYNIGEWEVDGTVTYSESENLFNQTGFDGRLLQSKNSKFEPTGVDVFLDTGAGNMDDYRYSVSGWENFSLNQDWKEAKSTSFSTNSQSSPNDMRFYVLGNQDNPVRDMHSGELNAKRFLDVPLLSDNHKITAVQFGTRYSSETLDNSLTQNSAAGINLANITDALLNTNTISNTSTTWFNGNMPGFESTGWLTMDTDAVVAALQDGLVVPEGDTLISETGFVMKTDRATGANALWAQNFVSEQDIVAAYAMADFDGHIGSLHYSGNVGARYVSTENTIDGYSQVEGLDGSIAIQPARTETDYDHLLPSLNMAFDLREDVVMRLGYSKGMVRPNLRAQTPALSYQENENRINIDYPASDVEPYTADMYDLSLEWYNRKGSAISVGVFQKEIDGVFATREECPVNGSEFADQLGQLERVEIAGGGFQCFQVDPFEREDGQIVQREVKIERTYNGDDSITVTGYELAVQQSLDFLPYPWNGFGGVLNYSYVENETEGEENLYKISPNSYNAIAYWENDGVSLRLAYNYRDEYALAGGASFTGVDDSNAKARGQLDFSGSYQLDSGITFRLRAYNLTDEQRYEYIGDNTMAVRRLNYDGRTYAASVSYAF